MRSTRKDLSNEFTFLTERALEEKENDKFIEILMRRASIGDSIFKIGRDTSWITEEDLIREKKVLERLHKIKEELLFQMEELSKKRRLIKLYSSSFPFPQTPAFFEKEE